MSDSSTPLAVSLILSLGCGAICAAITAPKMRNGIGWFILGMIFGPIAIVVAVIAPPLKDGSDEPPADMPSANPTGPARVDALATLADLRERGAITPEEYESEKAKLLASPPSS